MLSIQRWILAGLLLPGMLFAQTPQKPAVKAVTLKTEIIKTEMEFPGRIEAPENIDVRARIEGFIESIDYREGSRVAAGAVLFHIQPAQYEAAVLEAKAEVAKAEANLSSARADVEVLRAKAELERVKAAKIQAEENLRRILPLAEKEAVSLQERDAAVADEAQTRAQVVANEAVVNQAIINQKTAINVAVAQLEFAKANLKQAELKLSYTVVKAPVAGSIGRSAVSIGTLVGRGESTVLATVTSTDPMYVSFSVSERDYVQWTRSNPERNLKDKLPDLKISLLLADDKPYENDGQLNLADPTVDPKTGTLGLRAVFANPKGALLGGQFAKVRVTGEKAMEVLMVPQRAVREVQGNQSVFVAVNGKAEERAITTGVRRGSNWVVATGLNPGDQVLVEGLLQVKSGMDIDVIPVTATEAPGTAK